MISHTCQHILRHGNSLAPVLPSILLNRVTINIYRCPIKVILIWVVIPNGWEPSWTKAARTNPRVTLLSPSSISALPSLSHTHHFLPDVGCYFQLQPSLWTCSWFLGAAGSQARPFGILPAISLLQLRRCDPHSSLTSAGVVLRSDAVATDSASSGDGLCETGGGRRGVGVKESIVYWRFSRCEETRRWIISPRLPFPWKVGPDDLWRSLPARAVLRFCGCCRM